MIKNRLGLLYPKITQLKNRIKFKGEGSYTKAFLMVGFGLGICRNIGVSNICRLDDVSERSSCATMIRVF